MSSPASAAVGCAPVSATLLPLSVPAGIGGMCPGPALVALSSLQTPVLVFVAAMLLGQRLDQSVEEIACAVRKGVA